MAQKRRRRTRDYRQAASAFRSTELHLQTNELPTQLPVTTLSIFADVIVDFRRVSPADQRTAVAAFDDDTLNFR